MTSDVGTTDVAVGSGVGGTVGNGVTLTTSVDEDEVEVDDVGTTEVLDDSEVDEEGEVVELVVVKSPSTFRLRLSDDDPHAAVTRANEMEQRKIRRRIILKLYSESRRSAGQDTRSACRTIGRRRNSAWSSSSSLALRARRSIARWISSIAVANSPMRWAL